MIRSIVFVLAPAGAAGEQSGKVTGTEQPHTIEIRILTRTIAVNGASIGDIEFHGQNHHHAK